MANENRTQQASLGCGTLILIALIVLFFSGRGIGELERQVKGLKSEVGELRKAIEAQTTEIRRLQEMREES